MKFFSLNLICKFHLDVCGVMNGGANPRIIGGQEARPHQFPWLVAVAGQQGFCSSSLIGEEWVMTAAHCIEEDTRFAIIRLQYQVCLHCSGSTLLGYSESH